MTSTVHVSMPELRAEFKQPGGQIATALAIRQVAQVHRHRRRVPQNELGCEMASIDYEYRDPQRFTACLVQRARLARIYLVLCQR